MTLDVFSEWQNSFQEFCGRFSGFFARSESREQAAAYVRGLLSSLERKTGWQLSEVVGQTRPDRMQSLLSRGYWDEGGVRDELVGFVKEHLGEADGILILDETGFLKKGNQSAGVQRQYSGTAGRIENCQLGVFAAYSTGLGHCLVDRRLYLPQAWANDEPRRKKAKVPEEVAYRTKAELGGDMVAHMVSLGLPFTWVTADEIYGDSRKLRGQLCELGVRYVMAISCQTGVFSERPEIEEVEVANKRIRTGPRRKHRRVAESGAQAKRVDALVAGLSPQAWTPIAVAEGAKGPITYEWAALEVVECTGTGVYRLPGRDATLLVRRSLNDPSEVAYYLSNAPLSIGIEALARVAARRYVIEQCFREAKQDTGLDDYQVRRWGSWHRHITLSMMAMVWLTVARKIAHQKGEVLNPNLLRSPYQKSGDSSSSHYP